MKLLREYSGKDLNLEVDVKKNIPTCSGMGGGSTDAAVILNQLSKELGIDVDNASIKKMALSIGTDTLACLEQKSCVVTGLGNRVNFYNFPLQYPLHVVLLYPGGFYLSGHVYGSFKEKKLPFKSRFDVSDKDHYTISKIARYENSLQPIIEENFPETKEFLRVISDNKGAFLQG